MTILERKFFCVSLFFSLRTYCCEWDFFEDFDYHMELFYGNVIYMYIFI